jgi:hypothetical protein
VIDHGVQRRQQVVYQRFVAELIGGDGQLLYDARLLLHPGAAQEVVLPGRRARAGPLPVQVCLRFQLVGCGKWAYRLRA